MGDDKVRRLYAHVPIFILCNNAYLLNWQVRGAHRSNISNFRDGHAIGAPPIATSFYHRLGHYLDELWMRY
jgi:hypothetical protein